MVECVDSRERARVLSITRAHARCGAVGTLWADKTRARTACCTRARTVAAVRLEARAIHNAQRRRALDSIENAHAMLWIVQRRGECLPRPRAVGRRQHEDRHLASSLLRRTMPCPDERPPPKGRPSRQLLYFSMFAHMHKVSRLGRGRSAPSSTFLIHSSAALVTPHCRSSEAFPSLSVSRHARDQETRETGHGQAA